jgi:hypothetical protein
MPAIAGDLRERIAQRYCRLMASIAADRSPSTRAADA